MKVWKSTQGPSNLNQKSLFEDFVNFWRYMPTKQLQQRGNGSKHEDGIFLEGPFVGIEIRISLTNNQRQLTEVRILLPNNQRQCLRIVLFTVPHVSRSYEQFGNGFVLHLLPES